MHLYIIGFMGSGKTTLFKKWKQDFKGAAFDFDHELAQRLGIEPNQLGRWIETHGWEDFRARETELLKETLESREGLYALGGGTFHQKNIECINSYSQAQTLWLNTPVDLCWDRVRDDENRPLVKAGKDEFFALYKEREKLYSQSKYSLSGVEELPNLDEFWKNYVKNPSL